MQRYKIEFDTIPVEYSTLQKVFTSDKESKIVLTEIERFLSKGVTEKASHTKGEFISTIFTRHKKDGSHRLIFNLKNLNQFVTYKHFLKWKLFSMTTRKTKLLPGYQRFVSELPEICIPGDTL